MKFRRLIPTPALAAGRYYGATGPLPITREWQLSTQIGRTGDAQRALFPLARLRDIHAPDVRCPISLAVNGSEHRLHPFPEGLLCLSHGLAVHPWSRALRNLTQIRPYSFSCDVMGQGSEP